MGLISVVKSCYGHLCNQLRIIIIIIIIIYYFQTSKLILEIYHNYSATYSNSGYYKYSQRNSLYILSYVGGRS
jgi:hypothetical protein